MSADTEILLANALAKIEERLTAIEKQVTELRETVFPANPRDPYACPRCGSIDLVDVVLGAGTDDPRPLKYCRECMGATEPNAAKRT